MLSVFAYASERKWRQQLVQQVQQALAAANSHTDPVERRKAIDSLRFQVYVTGEFTLISSYNRNMPLELGQNLDAYL